MLKLIVLPLLTVTIWGSVFITPAYPPNAFQNQFYTVNFRIRGVDFPTCRFTGLPEGLNGDSEGTVFGVPIKAGSYLVKLMYSSGDQTGEQTFILKVLQSSLLNSSPVTATSTSKGLIISFPDNLIFKVGERIVLKLKASEGVEPYVWAFLNLPEGLVSNEKTGELQGYLKQAGYYNLKIEVADKEGKSASAFLTINAQSTSSLKTDKSIQVEIQNTKTQANLVAIEKEQVEAENSLFTALDLVDQNKKNVNQKKKLLVVQIVRQSNANISFNAAQQTFNKVSQWLASSQQKLTFLSNNLNSAKKNLQLASIEGSSASKTFNDYRSVFEVFEKRFKIAQNAQNDTQQVYSEAKQKYNNAEANLRDANTAKNFAFDEYFAAASSLQDARNHLEETRRHKSETDLTVNSTRDTLDLTIQANNNARNELAKADDILSKTEKILDARLSKVSDLIEKYTVAKTELQTQQREYESKLNKLFCAQARKQAVDRLSAIALAGGSLSDHNQATGINIIGSGTTFSQTAQSSSSFVKPSSFVGCNPSTYPSIVGTSQIKSIQLNGYTLTSGHQVLCGPCSQADKFNVGDWVSYNGVMVDSVVNAARIQKVLFS